MHYKVIFHINEIDKWKTVLGNVSNLLKDMGPEQVEVIVLANGESVRYYEEEFIEEKEILSTFVDLAEMGVKFVACNNALSSRNMKKDNLQPFVEVVPAGVSELLKRQHEGYAYIKP